MFLCLLIKFIFIMLAIAYFTLLERKILSLSQMRLGPNKVLMLGLIQPILDGLKLMKKLLIMSLNSMVLFLMMNSMWMFSISMLLWFMFPFFALMNKSSFFLWILLLFGFLSYFILMIGWSSMNKFSYLGGTRSLSQSLSFEILILLIMTPPFMISKCSLLTLSNKFSLINFTMILVFFILSILECQRSPMDLSEGESELVSGYNVELSSITFIFVFLGEYNTMIFMMMVMWFIYYTMSLFFLFISLSLMLLIRSCFPRIRYDFLMSLFWFKILPLIIIMLMIIMSFKMFSNSSDLTYNMKLYYKY
uniref:NADH-ubiquinone oxidoreductase chain 1 n=1 Tax=Romanomermis nielseni TaxID=416167 RepID=A1Z3A0_9BILA|nr:NADH dehydrogenase subunit 1 [Romanomermis nielseni]ABL73783.1 NADH dehydrogenase subunit 1 [Romanomermis nielseni]